MLLAELLFAPAGTAAAAAIALVWAPASLVPISPCYSLVWLYQQQQGLHGLLSQLLLTGLRHQPVLLLLLGLLGLSMLLLLLLSLLHQPVLLLLLLGLPGLSMLLLLPMSLLLLLPMLLLLLPMSLLLLLMLLYPGHATGRGVVAPAAGGSQSVPPATALHNPLLADEPPLGF